MVHDELAPVGVGVTVVTTPLGFKEPVLLGFAPHHGGDVGIGVEGTIRTAYPQSTSVACRIGDRGRAVWRGTVVTRRTVGGYVRPAIAVEDHIVGVPDAGGVESDRRTAGVGIVRAVAHEHTVARSTVDDRNIVGSIEAQRKLGRQTIEAQPQHRRGK